LGRDLVGQVGSGTASETQPVMPLATQSFTADHAA